ncbi:Cof-type HAD-IIB family hydrolase [Anaeromicropila populeti]|uniref:Haloacid dehalogenase-like hydrolase n=1 Tax=Anaeromicropila populeti TaxID=37658 RepID=A0A1I6JYS3_9FIRM|nr:Cof-type HAD-IIB family hydrolase [Anaeromicropila populeti]SFR84104.1 hypothetical protein SAMN05661086_02096 [Anaeromicropila populeti]
MAYEILVLDIDGTLTTSEKKVSERTLNAIFQIQERGHRVVLASGRPTPGILNLAKMLKLDEYGGFILAYNGAKVLDCKSGKTIYEKTLPMELLPELFEAAKEYKVGMLTYDTEGVIGFHVDEYIELEGRINHLSVKSVDNLISHVDSPVNKCIMTGDGMYLAEVEKKMKERFGDRLSIFRSEPFFLEIMPMNIDKAYSLERLLEHLGMTKEQMISCGDGFNDLTMIQYAGMGVAMGNAQEIVKEAADYITLTNDNDGVAHVIEKFM